MNGKMWVWVIALVLISILSRILPHPNNFTAATASLLVMAYIVRPMWLGMIASLAAVYFSDLFIDNIWYANAHEGFVWYRNGALGIYLAYVVNFVIGRYGISKQKIFSIPLGAAAASLSFFIISNFSVWLTDGLYTKTISGLTQCYIAAIPFLKNSLLSDMFYSMVLFAAFFIFQKEAVAQPAKSE